MDAVHIPASYKQGSVFKMFQITNVRLAIAIYIYMVSIKWLKVTKKVWQLSMQHSTGIF